MKYPAGLSGEEYAAMEEGYEQGLAAGRREQVTHHTEWGLMFDCVAQGCTTPHLDEREVMFRGGGERPVTRRVNGHAVRVVTRTVTTSDWRVAD